MNYPAASYEVSIILNSPLAPLLEREGKRHCASSRLNVFRGVSSGGVREGNFYPAASCEEFFLLK